MSTVKSRNLGYAIWLIAAILLAAFGWSASVQQKKLLAQKQAEDFQLVFGQPSSDRLKASLAVVSYFDAMLPAACRSVKASREVTSEEAPVMMDWRAFENRMSTAALLAHQAGVGNSVPQRYNDFATYQTIGSKDTWGIGCY